MPTYDSKYSARKVKAAREIAETIKKIEEIIDKAGSKAAAKPILKKLGFTGNQPKMSLRGLRSFLTSSDEVFADLLEQYEAGKLSAFKLADRARGRTETIGESERIIHSDTIHHANPLEFSDAFTEMESDELADFLTEEYEVHGRTYGDTLENIRGQSYTSRGHGAQKTNPRGRYKATNEFSEDGIRSISAHPRGLDDPLMKAPDIKPKTRQEALAYVESKAHLVEESKKLGAYADKDVRKLVDQKLAERQILKPGQTIYTPDTPDSILKAAKQSLDNLPDEIEIAKAFKTPKLKIINGVARFNYESGFANAGLIDKAGTLIKNNWKGEALGAGLSLLSRENRQNIASGNYRAAARNVVKDAAIGGVTQAVGKAALSVLPKFVGGAVSTIAAPLAVGAVAYQALDTIVDISTGRNIQETGQDAERMKAIRRQSGWSEHDLRRNARTGYKPPTPTPTSQPRPQPTSNTENCKINKRGRKVCK